MPLVIPEFVQFQGTLFPLRGLWNSRPAEGDKFVNLEVDWGSPGLLGVSCVQVQLSGNSPVAFSQIAAISVDNSRCGSNVDFVFPDSGFLLTVPAFNQGVYPVFSNALMFYINAPLAGVGDITIAQILNSVPPPVAIQPSSEQQQSALSGQNIVNGTTPVVPAPMGGTLNGFLIDYTLSPGASAVAAALYLIDGAGHVLWAGVVNAPASTPTTGTIPISGLHVRFQNGISLQITGAPSNVGTVNVNLYYSSP